MPDDIDPLVDSPDDSTQDEPDAAAKLVPLRHLQRLRSALAKANATIAERDTRIAELDPIAKRWADHEAAEAARLDAANAAALAALPEPVRAALGTLPREALTTALGAFKALAPAAQTEAAQTEAAKAEAVQAAKPAHPVGGQAQGSGGASAELTAAERKWAESRKLDTSILSVETIRHMRTKFGGAEAP